MPLLCVNDLLQEALF